MKVVGGISFVTAMICGFLCASFIEFHQTGITIHWPAFPFGASMMMLLAAAYECAGKARKR